MRRGEREIRAARIEIDIGVKNLAHLRGHRAAPDLNAKTVGRNHAGKSEHPGCERHICLIETNRAEAIRAACILRGGSGERGKGRGKQRRSVDAGPHADGLRDGLFDFRQLAARGLILRHDRHWLVFSAVLHWIAMLPGAVNWCKRTGHAEPPETATGWRTSGTIMLNE